MKAIIVPTDFSDCAASAYNYAALLAEKTGATIYLLHVLDIPFPSIATGDDAETTQDTHFMMELMNLTKSRMKKARARKEFKNSDIKEIIEVGPFPQRIFHAVEIYKADMIVMGTHGTSGLQEKFIGSNAEKVVRNANVPVLSVKHGVKKPTIETILFATDFSDEADRVLPAVNAVASLFKAKLILSKIVTQDKFEASAKVDEQIKKFSSKNKLYRFVTNVYYDHCKEDGIRHAANTAKASIIALGTHGRHGLAHFFRGSVAENVVSHASLPVLTINFKKNRIDLR